MSQHLSQVLNADESKTLLLATTNTVDAIVTDRAVAVRKRKNDAGGITTWFIFSVHESRLAPAACVPYKRWYPLARSSILTQTSPHRRPHLRRKKRDAINWNNVSLSMGVPIVTWISLAGWGLQCWQGSTARVKFDMLEADCVHRCTGPEKVGNEMVMVILEARAVWSFS